MKGKLFGTVSLIWNVIIIACCNMKGKRKWGFVTSRSDLRDLWICTRFPNSEYRSLFLLRSYVSWVLVWLSFLNSELNNLRQKYLPWVDWRLIPLHVVSTCCFLVIFSPVTPHQIFQWKLLPPRQTKIIFHHYTIFRYQDNRFTKISPVKLFTSHTKKYFLI